MNLYWWNGITNVGDAASKYLIEHLCSDVVKWKNPKRTIWNETKSILINLRHHKVYVPDIKNIMYPWQRCVFGIGSILDFANKQTIVWGSGYREYNSIYQKCEVKAVRGELSKDKLPKKYENIAIGDPALLLPRVYIPKIRQPKTKLKIIPHYADYSFFSSNYSDRFEILDVRTDNVESFIDAIVTSEYILSTSLHGLIISHAYNIPAIWIKKGYIYSSDFKFYDYFSSVNIPPYKAFTDIEQILENEETIDDFFNGHYDIASVNTDIEDLQLKLLKAAPFKLIEKYNKSIIL